MCTSFKSMESRRVFGELMFTFSKVMGRVLLFLVSEEKEGEKEAGGSNFYMGRFFYYLS